MPLTTPTVQTEILDGSAVITGNFTTDEAKKLTIAINSGALPLPIKLVEKKIIGPTLGEIEVKKSVYAGMVGLAMVLLFMIIYYGRLGFIASLALLIYGLISLFIFKAIPLVLTLPGVAGFILSIGMAVDSNILIFERIKEEQRKGKAFDIAVKLGFGRAIDAIKDANVTTLTVAFILFNPLNWEFLPQFGMVRGFALTLAIGVGTSLFTGVVITKRLINMFYKVKQL
jgi:preprotein translocase subunit SecD